MRKHLLCGVATAAIIVAVDGAVLAADMPVKAQPPVAAAARLLGWNGFYLGGHLGYGRARIDGSWDDGTATAINTKPAGLLGGMHAGQNWQTNTFVYGWEADISSTAWREVQYGLDDSSDGALTKIKLLASLRGRVGMAFDRTLFYATGGLAYINGDGKTFHHFQSAARLKFNAFGGVVGVGAEWKQTNHLSWRAEVLYYMFNKNSTANYEGAVQNAELRDVWVARLGATYHFGADAPVGVPVGVPVKAPVAAAPFGWTGYYVGGHLGYGQARFDGSFDVFNISQKSSGFLGGMHFGQNWLANQFLFGWETDLSAASQRWEKSTLGYTDTEDGVITNVSLLASLRGRIGIVSDRTLWYATGGLAYTRAKGIGHSSTLFHSQTRLNFNGFGGVVGAGVEWKQTPNLSWRAEGLYYAFGRGRNGLTSGGDAVRLKLKDAWVARLGATYHFDSYGIGKAPVAAKY